MKTNPVNKRIFALGLLIVSGVSAGAQTIAETVPFGMNELLWTVTILMGGLLLFLIGVMYRLLSILKDKESPTPKEEKLSTWEKLLSLRPMKDEASLTMDHSYDGIYELDNPTPPWFNFLFYGTIIIGIIYLIRYHVVGDGRVQENEYQAELAMWDAKKASYEAKHTESINENTVTLVTDPAKLQKSAELFTSKCSPCHGKKGEGISGPNLTDQYWLHGGKLSQVFNTITNGVPLKGMIPWKGILKPEQIQDMASYILSLQGTVPEGAGKEPQGEKMVAEPAEQAQDTASNETVSLLVK